MLKSTAGGGGIGLSRCNDANELQQAFESVQRLGKQFFRDAGVFIERYVDQARHVEVQIFGDGYGRVVALGERGLFGPTSESKGHRGNAGPRLARSPRVERCTRPRSDSRVGTAIARPARWSSFTTARATSSIFWK